MLHIHSEEEIRVSIAITVKQYMLCCYKKRVGLVRPMQCHRCLPFSLENDLPTTLNKQLYVKSMYEYKTLH
jgi:hypothetical protein